MVKANSNIEGIDIFNFEYELPLMQTIQRYFVQIYKKHN